MCWNHSMNFESAENDRSSNVVEFEQHHIANSWRGLVDSITWVRCCDTAKLVFDRQTDIVYQGERQDCFAMLDRLHTHTHTERERERERDSVSETDLKCCHAEQTDGLTDTCTFRCKQQSNERLKILVFQTCRVGYSSSRMRFMSHNWSATKQRLHPECSRDKPPFSFVRGQDSTMWDIVWVSPRGHRSVSVSRHFLQCNIKHCSLTH